MYNNLLKSRSGRVNFDSTYLEVPSELCWDPRYHAWQGNPGNNDIVSYIFGIYNCSKGECLEHQMAKWWNGKEAMLDVVVCND